MDTHHLLFKEMESSSELKACLKLRYQVYQKSRVAAWTFREPNQVIDIDGYDLYSRHYGIIDTTSGQPIAYMRVVQESVGLAFNAVQEIANEFNILIHTPAVQLPVMEYFPNAISTLEMIHAACTNRCTICEPGRFSIQSEFRSLSLTKSFIDYVFNQDQNRSTHAILSCVNTHVAFYKQYGFNMAKGVKACKVHERLPHVSLMVKEM